MPPDHAKLGSQEIPENAEANNVCQALHGMIRNLRCPLSCHAGHEGSRAKIPILHHQPKKENKSPKT